MCRCQTGLRGVKRELLLALTKCQRVKACQEVLDEYDIGKLDVNGIDYDQVLLLLSKTKKKNKQTKIDCLQIFQQQSIFCWPIISY